MPMLRDTNFTFNGLELIQVLRQFVDERCDDAGLEDHGAFYDATRGRAESLSDEEFVTIERDVRLRSTLRSLGAAREFVYKINRGD